MTDTRAFPRMDFTNIALLPQTSSDIVRVREADGFYLNASFSDDFRLRAEVYAKLIRAKTHLPADLTFMLYEAYRPLARQIEMWEAVQTEMRAKHPDMDPDAFQLLCETFIANPYDGIGSGHQAACAVDITLCTFDGRELDMGAPMHGFGPSTWTDASGLSETAVANRALLKTAIEAEGFLNYPAEWWHYSYGDHGWAWLAGASKAFYGAIDLSNRQVLP